MRSKIAIAGHPLHPMLVPLPIGLLVGSVIADFGYLLSDRNRMWYDVAFWTLALGVVAALVAALAGFGEYFTVARYTDGRRMAVTHMMLNLVAVALFSVSMLLRLDGNALDGMQYGAAFALSLVAVTVLAISGWIGGELSYKKHLGMVPHSAEDDARERERHALRT